MVRLKALAFALLLCAASVAAAQEKAPEFTFALHGFVSMSGYVQDGLTGPSEGQQSLFASPGPAGQPKYDHSLLGFDVRQSRFNFSVAGPKVFGGRATPKGVLEIDFFQGFGGGNYGDVSLLNRMRLAYAELDFGGGNRLAFGQQNDLIFAMAPTSLAHIAFPFGYAAGNIGWRRPAVWGFHSMGGGSAPKIEFAWEVGRSQWADQGTGTYNGIGQNTTADPNGINLGEASSLPAIEARLTLSQGTSWSVFATGHWNSVDRNGFGNPPAEPTNNLDVVAANVGAKIVAGPLTLAATGFAGKNLAPLIGNFLTFQPVTARSIHEWGGWVQGGFNFTKEFSAWLFAGTDKPSSADVTRATTAATARLQNVTTVGMLQYRDGGFAYGLEWIHFDTKYRTMATRADTYAKVDQWIASANYFF